MRYDLLILGFWLTVFYIGLSPAQAQQVHSKVVEVIVDGKQHKSIANYRRQKIIDNLIQVLSSENLNIYDEEELCKMIKEARAHQIHTILSEHAAESKSHSSGHLKHKKQTNEDEAYDLNPSQMQDMLRNYLKEHKEIPPISLDPQKVRNVIIQPKSQPEAGSVD